MERDLGGRHWGESRKAAVLARRRSRMRTEHRARTPGGAGEARLPGSCPRDNTQGPTAPHLPHTKLLENK